MFKFLPRPVSQVVANSRQGRVLSDSTKFQVMVSLNLLELFKCDRMGLIIFYIRPKYSTLLNIGAQMGFGDLGDLKQSLRFRFNLKMVVVLFNPYLS